MDFRYAYTLSKKKVKEILGKEIPLSSGLLSVLLSGCAGIILLEISAGVMVAIGAGLLALSVILHTTVMAEEIRKGKEKVMKREPKKKTEMKSITDYTDEGEGKP
jgi:hypothetical protein